MDFLSLQIIILQTLRFTVFHIMQKELVKINSAPITLSVAQACVWAIEPAKHSTFINQDAKMIPNTGDISLSRIQFIIGKKNIASIFTLNYDLEKDHSFMQ